MNLDPTIIKALTGYSLQLLPEILLAIAACILFLASTWKINQPIATTTALVALYGALTTLLISTQPLFSAVGIAVMLGGVFLLGLCSRDRHPLWLNMAVLGVLTVLCAHHEYVTHGAGTIEDQRESTRLLRKTDTAAADIQDAQQRTNSTVGPLYTTRLTIFIKFLAIIGSFLLVLLSWDEVEDAVAGEYFGCLLLITAGVCLTAAANDLVTLFLSLELISIPTYVLLYLPRSDRAGQEAAMKYFLLSIFSSAILLFGFSYLYGISGTTSIPAIIDSLDRSRNSGLSMVALVMILAGLGFKITAVPFHFYAPDVYQGTSTPGAATLAFVPKVAGFLVLIRLLGYVPQTAADANLIVSDQMPVLLWIMAAVTMSLGNLLAFLQDNIKRMLAYSGVAHAGYMLIGLAVAPRLAQDRVLLTGAVDAILFYLVAYGAMTIGAFAVLAAINSKERPVQTIGDLSGLGRSHPGLALMMALFLFSMLGLPLTIGFYGKFLLFGSALNLWSNSSTLSQGVTGLLTGSQTGQLFLILAVIGVINAAISGFYYLRMAGALFQGEELRPIQKRPSTPILVAIGICALITLVGGIYPEPLRAWIRYSLPHYTNSASVASSEEIQIETRVVNLPLANQTP